MLKSMTGFGRCEVSNDDYKISVEMKSVNHRYLDLAIKMPKKFNIFETAVRAVIKEYIQRGKVDVFITCEDYTQDRVSLKYNASLAKEYMNILGEMEQEFGITSDITAAALSRLPEVLSMEQIQEDDESLKELLTEGVRGAAVRFVEARTQEGEKLCADLLGKLDDMLEWVEAIEVRAPQILEDYKKRLTEKVKELLSSNSVDESRILTEVAIFADKISVDEEIVRLKSHIKGMRDALEKGGAVGRKLDFVAQEMNREANTILSKANDLSTSNLAIDLKTEIEKIREQIQNIE